MNAPVEAVTKTSLAEVSGEATTSTISRVRENGSAAAGSLSSTDSYRRMQELAYSEMAKRRRRLGPLTPAQEVALEALVETLVVRLSLMLAAAGGIDE